MHNFFRKNSKKLLAIVGVFLMISFIATSRMPTPGQRTAVPIGFIGKQAVLNTEVDTARDQLRTLLQTLVVQPQGSTDWQPMLSATQPIIAALIEDPKLFVLLQREADQMGVTVSNAPVDEQLAKFFRANVAVRAPDDRVVPLHSLSEGEDSEFAQRVQIAGERFIAILMAWNRAAEVTKISAPLRDYYLAQEHQNLQVRIVTFDAHKQLAKVGTPTPLQLQEQFNRFADVTATGFSTPVNPFGFGYQIPEQFKLETIAVTRAAITAAVKKSKTQYDWDVAAHYYYDKHLSDYPTTQAAATTLPSVVAARRPCRRRRPSRSTSSAET